MKNKIIISAIILATLNSCTETLTLKPSSDWQLENFYKNKEEVNMSLSGIYSQLASEDLYAQNFLTLDTGTDEGYTNDNTASWGDARFEYTPSDDPIKRMWTRFYSCVNLTNLFEKNLNSELFSEADYNKHLAKARFYRAFCYFTLANWWGAVPLRLTPSQQQSDNNFSASSAYDVYKQAEKDLLFAAKHLDHAKDKEYTPGEPNKMAAHGLLARLYLRMGGYQPYLSPNESQCYFPNNDQYFAKAKLHCDTIIYQDGWHSIVPYATDTLSYRTHFINYLQDRYDTKESLFEISFGHLRAQGIDVHGRLGNINGVEFRGTTGIPRAFCKIKASVVLYNLYNLNPTDKRLEYSIAGYSNTFNNTLNSFQMNYIMDKPLDVNYGIGKFRRWEPKDIEALKNAPNQRIVAAEYVILNNTASATDPNFTSINFPILRYSDVLLMYAEASIGGRYGTTPPDQRALDCLNAVRNRAGIKDPFTDTDHDKFFNELVNERLRELCFEGLRKHDLIRWNLLEEKLQETKQAIELHSTYNPNTAAHIAFTAPSRNFNKAKHLHLPYPLQEVEINRSLEQKPQYR